MPWRVGASDAELGYTEADVLSTVRTVRSTSRVGKRQMLSSVKLSSLLLKDYFLSIPNAVELFSSNFTFFSVFDIPVG